MTPEVLYKRVEVLDRQRHRALAMRPIDDWSPARAMNAVFVTAVEFGDVCKEYPIVFVRAGRDALGRDSIAPLALTGLTQGENLFLRDGGRWDARYIPAFVRRYPFALVPGGEGGAVVAIDADWGGWVTADAGAATGVAAPEPLFDAAGQSSAFLQRMQGFLQNFQQETERTAAFGDRLLQLGLLRDMRLDATLPSGEKLAIDGFLSLDAKKYAELPDAQVVELHRNGMLGLLQLQQLSLSNVQRLVERRIAATP